MAGPVPPPRSGPTTANRSMVALQAEFPDEDFGWMSDEISPVYSALVDAGWPIVECKRASVLGRISGVLLQRHLDGTGWIMDRHGGTICVLADMLAEQPTGGDPMGLRAWQPINIHQLSDSHVKVLRVIATGQAGFTGRDAPTASFDAGVIDEDIATATGLAVSTVGHLRVDLAHKCLVVAKQGIYGQRNSSTGARAQQWVATKAGHAALCPPVPSLDVLRAQVDRPAITAPG